MEQYSIKKAVLGRLPVYLKYLQNIRLEDNPYISASRIARDLNLGSVQVRKDLSGLGVEGKPRLGFKTIDLIDTIAGVLTDKQTVNVVLVGAGRLGRALISFDGFSQYGIHIAAAFDKNMPRDSDVEVLPMSQFDSFCRRNKVKIGIITTDEESAQQVCDTMVSAGITAVWNFTTRKVKVPEGILCENENLALSLAHLSTQLLTLNQEK